MSKWVVHIIGSDDVHDMPDEITALREANVINKGVVELMQKDPSPFNPFMVALVKDALIEDV